MVFQGRSTPLVRDDATAVWHAADDSGLKIEVLTDPAAGNGDNEGEYWRITVPDGTQYYFGLSQRPRVDAGDATNSTWTVPWGTRRSSMMDVSPLGTMKELVGPQRRSSRLGLEGSGMRRPPSMA